MANKQTYHFSVLKGFMVKIGFFKPSSPLFVGTIRQNYYTGQICRFASIFGGNRRVLKIASFIAHHLVTDCTSENNDSCLIQLPALGGEAAQRKKVVGRHAALKSRACKALAAKAVPFCVKEEQGSGRMTFL
jgi:hypothetical protein